MYYINKIVGWVLSPLGVFFLGLCLGWVLRKRGGRLGFVGAWVIGLSIAFLWLMSCGITTRLVGVGLERPWEHDGEMHGSIAGLPDADAIIALGGGVGAHEKCHAPELYSGADRVWQGARLYNAMKSRVPGLRVFCTGGGCEYAAIPLLADLGVPREAIWYSEKPRNTQEEAKLISEVLKRSGAVEKLGAEEFDSPTHSLPHSPTSRPKVLLVTSAWHMSRAKMLFDRAGFDVVPAPTDFEMTCASEKAIEFGDFFPSADAFLRNSYAVKEWVAQLGYSILRR
jgi:uncharacterized SAM-binding protein YcdF (DUF218 family)